MSRQGRVADAVAGAFDRSRTRNELVQFASDQGAPVDVVATLHRLPDARFTGLRDLWVHLSDLPVDRDA
jgi:hypothetical protein